MDIYCKKCALKKGHPGIQFDENNLCSMCNGKMKREYSKKDDDIINDYQNFKNRIPVKGTEYDCLFMLSGGKDSVYMLKKLKKEITGRILAYYHKHRFDSDASFQNIETILQADDFDFISYGSYRKHRELMKYLILNCRKKDSPALDDECIPCNTCHYYFIATACQMAIKMGIKYVVHCGNPRQMRTIPANFKDIVKIMLETIDKTLLNEILNNQLDIILNTDDDNLPKIIFPYSEQINEYDGEKIIKELTEMGYTPDSMVTLCHIFPLLEYYSYKNYNCYSEALESAYWVRQGQLEREAFIQLDKENKKIILEIALKETISQEEKLFIKNHAQKLFPDNPLDSDAFYNRIILFRKIADDLGILDEILRIEKITDAQI
ncbi:MAG: hypothetical protein HQK75_05220 [Candidatus Magnetomorum sp.]|nr:hypothetical protein [Candidatus Magnetomorum sp.]